MNNKDDTTNISNPRLLGAVYFGLLAVIANIFINSVLYDLFGVQEFMPFFEAVLLAAVVASGFGALFGKPIIRCQSPYKAKVFWLGFLMVMAALPVHTLGFLYFFEGTHAHLFQEASPIYYAKMYLLVLFYSFILFGIWLAIFAGIAAIYLRGHLIFHIMNALYSRPRKTGKAKRVVGQPTPAHGQATISSEEYTKNNESSKNQ